MQNWKSCLKDKIGRVTRLFAKEERMAYITEEEYKSFGFDPLETTTFDGLEKRAAVSINLYTRNLYAYTPLENEPDHRKQAVKLAMAYQINYLDASGTLTAEDRTAFKSVSIGRTSISYGETDQGARSLFNLCQDAINALNMAGFGDLVKVSYDR